MAKLLHILAHPDPATSRSAEIAVAFLESYAETHHDDEIVLLDLYREQVPYLSAAHLRAMSKQGAPVSMDEEEQRAWAEMLTMISYLREAQKILVTSPMWNYTVPAILKAFIDLVVVAGQTLRFTESGPVGLLTGRRAMLISTYGGIYSAPAVAGGITTTHYVRAVLELMGIEVAGEVVVEGTNYLPPDVVKQVIDDADARARTLAKTF